MFRFFQDSFNAWLTDFKLLYQYEVPLSLTVHALLIRVAEDMHQSTANHTFQVVQQCSHLDHEVLPLTLLSLIGKGHPNTHNQVRLRLQPIRPDLTIQELLLDKNKYVAPVCIENRCFVIHAGVYAFHLVSDSALTFPAVTCYPLTSTVDGHRHCCISKRVQFHFPDDTPDIPQCNINEYASSGGESMEVGDAGDGNSDYINGTALATREASPITQSATAASAGTGNSLIALVSCAECSTST